MEVKVQVPKLIQLEKNFQDLAFADKKKILNKVFRRALQPTVVQARANVRSVSGDLRKSIGTTAVRGEIAYMIGARKTRGYKGHKGHLLEDGTAQRHYVAKKRCVYYRNGRFYSVKEGDVIRTGALNPDKSYGRWLKKATDSTGKEALNIMAREWYSEIDKYLKRGMR